jgi:hypothetical protein
MFGACDYLFRLIPYLHIYDERLSALCLDSSHSPMISSMGHSLMCGWLYQNCYSVTRLIDSQDSAKAYLSSFSRFFGE